MSIPKSCTVLVIGSGPGGSYTASALAREGVDTVVLESDVFPRYHIGESMLASIRYFLRFIDLESKMDEYGFQKKIGSAFKLNEKRAGYTDFIAINGPDGYAWNFIRSESDHLMFKHAAESGAHVFDGVKVESIDFDTTPPEAKASSPSVNGSDPKVENSNNLGRPISAKWHRKADGSAGVINFDYLVDASGRAGIMSTRYLKNRKYNQSLKNVALWGYWKGAKPYAPGTPMAGQPISEALDDGSGWTWAIPLHDGTLSVGIVIRQDVFLERKKAGGGLRSEVDFYKECLRSAPVVWGEILAAAPEANGSGLGGSGAELASGLKSASDWSYNAPTYAGPGFRIVGDAGCFIDPYFSSGVHLAIASGLSAAMTIQASRRGECDELVASKWHSNKVTDGYTRFLLVVLAVMRQIRRGTEPLLSDFDEEGFDRAFGFFMPIIQGLADADVGGKLTQERVSKTVGFCLNAFGEVTAEDRHAVLAKLDRLKDNAATESKQDLEHLTEDELQVLRTIRARQLMRTEDLLHIEHFKEDAIDGLAPRLRRGELGLEKVADASQAPSYHESLFESIRTPGEERESVLPSLGEIN